MQHVTARRANNRAEASHPPTLARERQMRGFKSPNQLPPPERGWFDEGPHRGPWCQAQRGLASPPANGKARAVRLLTAPTNSGCPHCSLFKTFCATERCCSYSRFWPSPALSPTKSPWKYTPERQSLEESTARGGGLPVASYKKGRPRLASSEAFLAEHTFYQWVERESPFFMNNPG